MDATSLDELNLPPLLIYMPFTLSFLQADGTAPVPKDYRNEMLIKMRSYRQTSKGEGQSEWAKNTAGSFDHNKPWITNSVVWVRLYR